MASSGFREEKGKGLAGRQKLSLCVLGTEGPLALCPVLAEFSGPSGPDSVIQVTDDDGRVTFEFADDEVLDAVLLQPIATYWNMVVVSPENNSTFELQPLPISGPTHWWHDSMGLGKFDPLRGEGIKIGVIDSGCSDHPHLNPVDAGAILGQRFFESGKDVLGHGTHVCGLLISLPNPLHSGYSGLAPGSELISVRVFDGQKGAGQGDIAEAINQLSEGQGVHLINLSLGLSKSDSSLHDAVKDAADRGTLILAAAGNSGKRVMFPAAYPEVVAVSAIGRRGWGAKHSITKERKPHERGEKDSFFVPAFSCVGTEVDCCAPGVGIISTVPPSPKSPLAYGAMDGTSMATPLACGLLAGLLASDKVYLSMKPNRERTEYARNILISHCKDLGLPPILQGRGLVNRTG